jgi:hypothetical protein
MEVSRLPTVPTKARTVLGSAGAPGLRCPAITQRRPLRTATLTLALLVAAGAGAAVPAAPARAATPPGELLVYYGWPSLINGVPYVTEAAAEFAAYDFVVIGAGIELPDHPDHQAAATVIAQPVMADTLVFGYINLGVTSETLTLTEVYQRVDWWQAMGIHGILFDAFGYDWEVTRERQNAAVEYAHSLGMPVVANGWLPADVFGDDAVPVYNPGAVPTQLGARDYYMSESYFVQVGEYQDYQYWRDKADLLASYQAELGFGILSVTTNGPHDVYSQELHYAAWNAAAEYGHTATGWGEYLFSADDNLAPFRPRPPGFLRVTTTPAVPSQILVDGVPRDTWGLNWLQLPPGAYEVSFSDMPGFTAPTPQTVTVTAGETTAASGSFGEQGWLRVITDPAVPSTIYVDGIPRNDWGMWTDLPPGDHQVCFGDVEGFATPACQTANLAAGATAIVTGSFVAGSSDPLPAYGMLRVTTDPPVPSQILIDGIPRDTWGLNWVKLPPGEYEVSFADVPGFTTPTPQTVTINEGETTDMMGVFEERGWLRVITDPAAPSTVYVNSMPRNDWGMWTDLPAGAYEVSFGYVPGYMTPLRLTTNLTAGVLTTITGTFSP